jgi:hypothetical protein
VSKKERSRSRALPAGTPYVKMKFEILPEQLFVSVVDMDPALDGFSGVLVEIYRERDPSGGFRYVLLETASATGNHLLKFTSTDPSVVARILLREIGGLRGFEGVPEELLR